MILAANFKMNHTRSSTKEYIDSLCRFLKNGNFDQDIEIYLFPPATALDSYECESVRIGAQNAYCAEEGSFTGEIGPVQLGEFGIETVLIGHSERRELFGESQELIDKKFAFYKERGYEIFYCIGERLDIRERGIEEVKSFLRRQLLNIDTDYENLIIAYEPVWAIGTGKSAHTEDIAEVMEFLGSITDAPLLYGGSVKAGNIESIISVEGCEGALIGTASWKVDSFCEIIERAQMRKRS